jgi:hypothetical protein
MYVPLSVGGEKDRIRRQHEAFSSPLGKSPLRSDLTRNTFVPGYVPTPPVECSAMDFGVAEGADSGTTQVHAGGLRCRRPQARSIQGMRCNLIPPMQVVEGDVRAV